MRDDDLCELGVVKTATPCDEPWESMRGSGAVRYCDRCRLDVYDFAQLSTSEARDLIVKTEGRLCGRIFTREDGTVLTRDCPTGVVQRRNKRVRGVAVAAALLGGAAGLAAAPPRSCDYDAKAVEIIPSGNAHRSTLTGLILVPTKPAR